jgi:tRNA threonylcarbamoyladenosine biosynthesis protein TsaB
MPLVEDRRIRHAESKRCSAMRILAIETTDKAGSVAAIDNDNLLAELMLDHTQRSAQSLAPGIDHLLKQVGWRPSDVQLAAVSIGPGSFTGLRVGVTAAKVFAYTVGAEVLGVNTLEAVAANCSIGPLNEISVVIDAQRGEVVVQSFLRQADGWFEPAGAEELLDADVWLARLQTVVSQVSPLPLGEGSGVRACQATQQKSNLQNTASPHPSPLPKREGTVVTGPGIARLLDRLPPGVAALHQDYWHPRAAAVARVAARCHAQGRRDDLWKLVPHYYRRSAAEEKWDARMAKQ